MGRKEKLRTGLRQLRRSLAGCSHFGAVTFIDAARILGISPLQLGRRVASGALLAIHVRGERMIPRSELRRALKKPASH